MTASILSNKKIRSHNSESFEIQNIFRNKIFHESATHSWSMPDNSIDAIITSPPYWQHRNNGIETVTTLGGDEKHEHCWTNRNCPCGAEQIQIGHEKTPQEYVEHLVKIFSTEGKRVLKPFGQLWVNLGDTFSKGIKGIHGGEQKQQLLIPFRFAISMQDNGWVLRNTLIWAKSVTFEDGTAKGGGMPSAVHDRLNLNYEPFFGFVKEKKRRTPYYFDQDKFRISWSKKKSGRMVDYFSNMDLLRIKPKWVNEKGQRIDLYGRIAGSRPNAGASPKQHSLGQPHYQIFNHPFGKNPASIWLINIDPFNGQRISHTSPYPISLIKKIIMFSSPESVCNKCNLPISKSFNRKTKALETLCCACNDGRQSSIIFDPFMGSGTTALAAIELGRDFCGLELNQQYLKEAENRIRKTRHKLSDKLTDFV